MGGKKVFPEELRTASPRPVCLPHFQPFPRSALRPRGPMPAGCGSWFPVSGLPSVFFSKERHSRGRGGGARRKKAGCCFSSASTASLAVAESPVWMHLLPDSPWAPGTAPAPLCLWPRGGDSFLLLLIGGWLSILSWSLSSSVTCATSSPAFSCSGRKYLKWLQFSW